MSTYNIYTTNSTGLSSLTGNIANIPDSLILDECSSSKPEDVLFDCEPEDVLFDCEPKRVRRKIFNRVRFAYDVKEHDGQKPDTFVFEKLVVHYLKIGGMTCPSQMVCFLETHSVTMDNKEMISKLKDRIDDLVDRLKECEPVNSIPILPGGGGSNYKIGAIALPNINHLKIVFEVVLKA